MLHISFISRAEKQFSQLPQELKQKIYDELKKLSEQAFLYSDVKKIKGTKIGYRLRVGHWRIFFALFSEEKRLEIVDIFLKKGKEDYQKRKRLLK